MAITLRFAGQTDNDELVSAIPRNPTSQIAIERGQRLLLVAIVLLTIGAWAITIYQARTMDMPMGIVLRGIGDTAADSVEVMSADSPAADTSMAGMDMGDSSPADVQSAVSTGMSGMGMVTWTWDSITTFLVAWTVMMVAMMFPAAAPMVLLYHKMASERRNTTETMAGTWVFLGGYLLVWSLAGVVTWVLVQVGIEYGSRLGSSDRDTWAPIALGGTLLIAAAYQFTPLKERCLRQCQSPVGFLMTHWRPGNRGAVEMGFVHGAYCLGCCWALFAVLVAAGVMSLAWMLLLTAIVFAEKVLPAPRWMPQAVGVAFAGLGLLVAGGAFHMPWLA